MKSKIFGIGLSRTGTTSLNNFLRELGYNVIHYPYEQDLWAFNNDGGTDITVTNNYKELDLRFPNSKFIHTTRNKEEWLDSIVPYLERKRSWNMGSWAVDNKTKLYGTPFPDRDQASKAWDKHGYDVYKYFENRLNDYIKIDIVGGDSPKELLKFLGKPEDLMTEFPHDNKLKRK